MTCRGRDEAGFSLIEMLIAVAILGIAVVTIVSGMGAAIFASDRHRKEADATAILVSAAEHVKSDATPHAACATPASYLAAAQTVALPHKWTSNAITVPAVSYWNGSAFQGAAFVDGVSTNSSKNYTSATAGFVAADVGKPITGTNIPAKTTIAAFDITKPTTVVLSNAATASGTGLAFTVGCYESGADAIPLTLQLVTIKVASPDGRATQSVSVVKN